MIRGMQDAFNKYLKDFEEYNSPQNLVKRAKKKLLFEGYIDEKIFEYDLKTQKALWLRCTDKGFNISLPAIDSDYIYQHELFFKDVTYDNLCDRLNSHMISCLNHQIAKYGDLTIGFYNKDTYDNLAGVIDNEIVFMFCTRLRDNSNDFPTVNTNFVDNQINIKINKYEFKLSIEDYLIKKVF